MIDGSSGGELVEFRERRLPVGEWRPAFLRALKVSGNVRLACQMAGIDRRTALRHREYSKEFAQEWDEAMDDALDTLEAEAWRRAKGGSDMLLWNILRTQRRDKYGERSVVEHQLSPARRKELEDACAREGLDAAEVIAQAELFLKGKH